MIQLKCPNHVGRDCSLSKAVILFTSNGPNGQPGEITFEIRYYGSSYTENLQLLFYSRVIAGRQNAAFNHRVFDVENINFEDKITFFEDLNLNQNKVVNLGDPQDNGDAATKHYVDNRSINNIASDLDMKNHKIINLQTQSDVDITDYPNYLQDQKTVVNKLYLNSKFLKKKIKMNIILI